MRPFGPRVDATASHSAPFEKRSEKVLKRRGRTGAEILALLSELSLKAPLKTDYFVLAMELTRELLGQDLEGKDRRSETYQGAVAELRAELRKATTRIGRDISKARP